MAEIRVSSYFAFERVYIPSASQVCRVSVFLQFDRVKEQGWSKTYNLHAVITFSETSPSSTMPSCRLMSFFLITAIVSWSLVADSTTPAPSATTDSYRDVPTNYGGGIGRDGKPLEPYWRPEFHPINNIQVSQGKEKGGGEKEKKKKKKKNAI